MSFEFALLIIEYYEDLKERHHFTIHNQHVRSGTAIGALVREAQSPESRKDFIHKLKTAMKEAEEREYWLILCEKSQFLPGPDISLQKHLTRVQKLLSRIIASTKSKL